MFPEKNIIFNKWIKNTGMWPDYNRRLFRKGHLTWQDKIHSIPEAKGSIKKLEASEKKIVLSIITTKQSNNILID